MTATVTATRLDVEVETAQLRAAVTEARRFTGRRTARPGQRGVRLQAGASELRISANGPSAAVLETLAASVEARGAVFVDCADLAAALAACDAARIRLVSDELHLAVHDGDDRFALELLGLDRCDPVPAPADTSVCDGLVDTLRRVLVAASNDTARPSLAAVWFGDGTLVATDAVGMAFSRQPLAFDVGALVPAAALTSILKSKPARLAVGHADGHTTFHDPDAVRTWVVVDVDATVPDYDGVIAGGHASAVTVARAEMVQAVKKAATQATGGKVPVVVSADGAAVAVTCRNGGVRVDTSVAARLEGPPATVAFDPAYLLTALRRVLTADEVAVQVRGPEQPCVLVDGGPVGYLLMPMAMP